MHGRHVVNNIQRPQVQQIDLFVSSSRRRLVGFQFFDKSLKTIPGASERKKLFIS